LSKATLPEAKKVVFGVGILGLKGDHLFPWFQTRKEKKKTKALFSL
jgi:hypothetical protein